MKDVACYLCGNTGIETIQNGVRHDNTSKVKKCDHCGLVFLFPLPDEKELNNYYAIQYRNEYHDPPAPERFVSDLPEAKIRLKRIKRYLNFDTSILEVGCGTGAFLSQVKPLVKKVVGIEVDEESRTWIQKNFKIDVYSDIKKQDDKLKFDIIVMFHVLEHLLNPVEYLSNPKKILKDNGRIFIEVPNINDALLSLYNIDTFKKFYFQKAHLCYFSKETLTKVCEKAGLSTSVRGIQRYDFNNHIHWMITGKPGGQGFFQSIFPDSFCKQYARILIEKGYSDTLWAVAKKQNTGEEHE
ncbi:MAG: class I SAM-dependent methyltransferase [Candidatus Ratteibacteria bacterium]